MKVGKREIFHERARVSRLKSFVATPAAGGRLTNESDELSVDALKFDSYKNAADFREEFEATKFLERKRYSGR